MVEDQVTGLVWQKETSSGTYTWNGAVSYCEGINIGGYSDWRLPESKELSYLIDRGRYNPAIDTVFFPDTILSYYWSATSDDTHPDNYGASVDFSYGNVTGTSNKSDAHYVRCVRGEQPQTALEDNGDGTVTDTVTGLIWQQQDDSNLMTWEQALNYCEEFSLADETDWRLPDSNELQSLVDCSHYHPWNVSQPTIDPLFTDTKPHGYWSSTINAAYLGPWDVDFRAGHVNSVSSHNYVRCVRGGQ